MTKVFISATSRDLAAFHAAACDACSKLQLEYRDMKDFPAESKGATQASLDHLDECDLYIGIFAFRYGYEEDGYDGVSVTDMEYRHAEKRGLDRLCFLADENQWTGIKDPDLTKVKAFRDNILPNLVVSFFGDEVKDFQLKLMAALSRWKEKNPSRPGGTSAVLFKTPKVQNNPSKLFGRDDLVSQIHTQLDNNGRVLLHGFGGMGKTALAARVASERIDAGKGNVLWLRLGTSDADALCESLARPFGAQQVIARELGDARLAATSALLTEARPGLLVLDDAWSGSALFQLLKAIPNDLPLIVTSRQTYAIDGEFFDVAELPEADAIKLVAYHAKRHDDADMPTLCKKLGNHAFALEIAGRTMHTRKWSAAAMLQQIKDAPHELKTPLDFSEKERSSVKDLLDTSFAALPDDITRNVFLAFGAFFAPRLTPELVLLYFFGEPEVSDEMLAQVRAQNPQTKEMSDDELRPMIRVKHDTTPAQNALNTLTDYGLAWRIDADDEAIESFRIHDLAYSYVLAQSNDENKNHALDACLKYIEYYNTPSPENFRTLSPELDNFIEAATYAFSQGRWKDVEKFVWNLITGSEVILYRNLYVKVITLLEQAIIAAQRRGDRASEDAHSANLGATYVELGQYSKAIELYKKALAFAQETSNLTNEGNSLGWLGNAHNGLGQYDKAIEFYDQALTIASKIKDRSNQGNWISALGSVYRKKQQYEKAIELYTEAIAIAKEIDDKRALTRRLGRLGIIYDDLKQPQKAIESYKEAYTIAAEIGDRRNELGWLGELGLTYANIGQTDLAIKHLTRVLNLARSVSDSELEGKSLGNLGTIYTQMGQYDEAIAHHSQALSIARKLDDKEGEGDELNNLGVAYEFKKDFVQALEYYKQSKDVYVSIEGLGYRVKQLDENITFIQRRIEFEAMVYIYREEGEDGLRTVLLQAGGTDDVIERVVQDIKTYIANDE